MINTIPLIKKPTVSVLREKIGWLCEAIRWLIVIWLLWQFYYNFGFLITQSIPQTAVEWGKYWGLPDGTVTVSKVLLNRALVFVSWAAAALLGVAVWKLMSGYLAGDILSSTAAGRLRFVGLTGIAAAVIDIVVRPPLFAVLSTDILKKIEYIDWVEPRDLLYILISLFLLSLAYIQGTAAAINDEHQQIV